MRTKHLTVKQARSRKGWTQCELEEATARIDPKRLGLDQRAISKIESHKVADPMNSTVVLLEAALGLQRGTLVFGRDAEAIERRSQKAAVAAEASL